MGTDFHLKEINCSNCGGQIQFDPNTKLVICNFCGSTFDLRQAKVVQPVVPDGIVPFKISKEQFHQLILKWLIQGDYTPDDILTSSTLRQVSGIYLPFYLVQGNYSGSWSASSGYERQEAYTEYVRKTRYVNNRTIEYTEPETRYRTVTDWRPSSGGITGQFKSLGIASGILDKETMSFCEGAGWGSGDMMGFDSRYILGFGLEDFSIKEEEVFRVRVEPKLDIKIDSEVYDMVPGDRKTNIQWNANKQVTKTSRIYLPFWLTSYSYNNEKFQCAIDGQQPNRIHGKRPLDKERVRKIKLLFLPFLLISITTVIALAYCFFQTNYIQYAEKIAIWGSLSSAISGLTAFLMKKNILKQSYKLRQKYLQQSLTSQNKLVEDLNVEMLQLPSVQIKHDQFKKSLTFTNYYFIILFFVILGIGYLIFKPFHNPQPQNETLKVNVDNPADIEKGISKIENYIQQRPNDPMLWYNLGRMYYYKKDTTNTNSSFKKALILGLSDSTALTEAGNFLLNKDYEGAAKAFNKLISTYPNNIHAYNMLGTIYYAQKKFKESIQQLKIATRLNPQDATSWLSLTYSYYVSGSFNLALGTIKKSLKLNPNIATGYWLLGECYLNKCELDSAKAVLEKAQEDKWTINRAKLSLAKVFLIEDNLDVTQRILDEIVDGDSTIIGAKYTMLGRLLENRNEMENAKIYYLKAISCSQDVGAYANLGMLLIQQNETQDGLNYLKKTNELNPLLKEIDFNLGVIFYSKGIKSYAIRLIKLSSLLGNDKAKYWLKNNDNTIF